MRKRYKDIVEEKEGEEEGREEGNVKAQLFSGGAATVQGCHLQRPGSSQHVRTTPGLAFSRVVPFVRVVFTVAIVYVGRC